MISKKQDQPSVESKELLMPLSDDEMISIVGGKIGIGAVAGARSSSTSAIGDGMLSPYEEYCRVAPHSTACRGSGRSRGHVFAI
jgi:hypothetical protein